MLDFVKDMSGNEWFIGCKAFKAYDKGQPNGKVDEKLRDGLLFNLVYFSRSNKQVTQ